MRSSYKGWMALALLGGCGALLGVGCENTAGQCELTAECTGAAGVVPGACDPNKSDGPIPDTCGTFASSSASAAEADGSPGKPFTTLAQAIDAAKSTTGARVVYACAETFEESAVLPADFKLYGGLDCKNGWMVDPLARTTIAPTEGIPLTFEAGETVHVENVRALAPEGAPASAASESAASGGSSIAAFAMPGSSLELVRCDLAAGAGAPGASIPAASPGPAAPAGQPGDDACSGRGQGGPGGALTCEGEGDATDGGKGGEGSPSPMRPGSPGTAGGPSGAGGTPGDGQDDVTPCGDGMPGSPGLDGTAGAGAKLLAGFVDTTTWRGVPGGAGKAGRPGTGGGGGGGGKGCVGGSRGGGGGGGGAGGCGGAGGKGGGGGGSSIALWAVDATVSLDQSTLTAQSGGPAAAGGDGQEGSPGGTGGPAGAEADGSVACDGGDGGKGGKGGKGGGGQGGSSIAVVWKKNAPSLTGASTLTPGTPGSGGPGDPGSPQESNGEDGLSCAGFDIEIGQCMDP